MSLTNQRSPGAARGARARSRVRLGAGALLLLLAASALRQSPRASAQAAGQLLFTGTIETNLGQPVLSGTSLTVVAASTNTPCGQGVIGAGGSYSVAITPVSPCNAVGTSLVVQVSGLAASPTAFVTTSSGVVLLNLTVAGLSPSSVVAGNVLTPPSSPPAGSGAATTGGTLIPPTTSPPQSGAQTTATTSTAAATQPAQAAAHTVSLPLTSGCNQVVVAFGASAQPQQVVAAVANVSSVVSVWHFDNAAQRYSGYFPTPGVPSDLTALNAVDAVFICVSADTTISAPQP